MFCGGRKRDSRDGEAGVLAFAAAHATDWIAELQELLDVVGAEARAAELLVWAELALDGLAVAGRQQVAAMGWFART